MILKVAILTERQSFKHLCCELIESNSQLTRTGSYINYAFLRRSFKIPDLIITDKLGGLDCQLLEHLRAGKDENLKDAFGAGTAATIAHIELIGYDGKDYVLPPVETREFSNKILKELNDIKCGKIEDRFNWIYTI